MWLFNTLYILFYPGVLVKCPGQPGHGSQFLPNTAGEKLQKVINAFLKYRTEQELKLKENEDIRLGDVTSVNLTILEVKSYLKSWQTVKVIHYVWITYIFVFFQPLNYEKHAESLIICFYYLHVFYLAEQGGVQFNVVPSELSVGFDIRITPTQDLGEFEEMIKGWCKAAGKDVVYEFRQKVVLVQIW